MTKQSTKHLAAVAAGATLLALGVTAPAQALAPENPFSADSQPTWQTNGIVWALTAAQGRVFAGGTFTQVRPPGTSSGHASSLNRSNLVVLDAGTGSPISDCIVNVTLATSTPTVRSLAASPDGSVVYLGGSFGAVNGVSRSNIAAIDPATCEVLPFNPGANSWVYAIAATADTVYYGGRFTSAGGVARTRVAAATDDGVLLPWAPTVEDEVLALGIDPNNGNVVLGGRMDTVNGQDSHALAVVDGVTGKVNVKRYPQPFFPYSPGDGPRAQNSVIKAIATDATGFYIGAEGSGHGIFDGRAAFDWSDYNQRWRDNCLGATQALDVHEGTLFIGNHAHDCITEGTFDDGIRRHLNAQRTDDKTFIPWWPNTNGGLSEALGPRAVVVAQKGDAHHLWYGGEFTTVNAQPQQGLTRFSEGMDRGVPNTPQMPTLTSTKPGEVRVMIRATSDNDDTTLTYDVFRGDGTTPINDAPLTADSVFYDRPQVVFTDTGLTPGSTQTYRVRASDGTNPPSAYSPSRSITVSGSTNQYANQVVNDGASVYFRMEEATGGSVAGNNGSGPLAGSYCRADSASACSNADAPPIAGQPSGLARYGGTSALFNGTDSFLRTDSRQMAPSTYSVELWFKTSTTRGGRLIGYGNRGMTNGATAYPDSTQYDRHVYMGTDGRLRFGTLNGSTAVTIASSAAYNNNVWHHVVATQGPSGMALYVDGNRASTHTNTQAATINGFWRIGGDGMTSTIWPSKPTTGYFAGNIDEVAVYDDVLTAAQVTNHYGLASSTKTVTVPAEADTQVKQASPNTNYGNGATLWADTDDVPGNPNTRVHDYLRFEVPELAAGESITGARLSLNVTNATPNGQAIFRTNPAWDEATMTWASGRPARTSGTAAVGNFGNMPISRVSTPVSGITAGGDVSFELSPESGDGVLVSSRNATTESTRPQLILTISAEEDASDTTPPPAPDVNPDSGTYADAQSVTMSDTEAGAIIRYTTGDGTDVPTDPTSSSPQYTGPINVDSSRIIKARAFDAAGNASPVTQREYTITPTTTRTVTLRPTEDTQVKQASPGSNYGSGATLWMDSEDIAGNASSAVHSYLKFDLPALATGESITDARLSLNVTNTTGNGPAIYRTEDTWDESTMTWNTDRPGRSSTTAVGNFGSMASVARFSTPVTGVTEGLNSFELDPDSTDGVLVSSSEAANPDHQPELIVTISS